MVKAAAALIGVCLAFAGVVAQQPARDAQPPRIGTASIAGVIARGDGPKGPLRRARVTVTGGGLISPRIDTTDDRGRFEIGGLPPGQYAVSASKPAYLAMNFGATRPGWLGTSIALADGQRVANVAIALPRGAVIAGVVMNSVGEPMSNAYVTLLHRRMYNGERRFLSVASGGFTTDRGEYRAYGLAAGEYLVVAQAFADLGLPPEVIRLTAADVDRALLESQQAARMSNVAPSAARPSRIGFAPVFHPATANGALATTVNLAQGEERTGVDIRLDLVPTARIDGVVTSGDGAALPALQVILTSLGPPTTWEEYGYGGRLGPKTPDAQGKFSFAGVPPGDYSLVATTQLRSTPFNRNPAAQPNSRLAHTTLSINGDDQTVALTLQPGMSMSGRFVFEGTTAPSAMPGARVVVEDLWVEQNGSVRTYTAEPGADGTFRIADILPGRFKLSNESRPGLALTSGWALKSVAAGSRDLLDAPFELRPNESLADVVVTMTDRPSELTGTLQNSSGTPTSDFFIVAFAVDRQFWFPNSRRLTAVRPNTSGAYAIRNLPPGEYFIVALTDVEDGEWFDPEFLNKLVAPSTLKIAIGDGEKKRQDLRVGR